MKPVTREEALAQISDGECVYVVMEGCDYLDGSEQTEHYEYVEYARITSHEEVEDERLRDQLYIWA